MQQCTMAIAELNSVLLRLTSRRNAVALREALAGLNVLTLNAWAAAGQQQTFVMDNNANIVLPLSTDLQTRGRPRNIAPIRITKRKSRRFEDHDKENIDPSSTPAKILKVASSASVRDENEDNTIGRINKNPLLS
ncbi:hypothetical protein ANCCAN_11717 [Ancylostoma caninum]|uniref:Uncharacterized protein n=1 Tax=Ancylostoma caninum TaxID=29170 RepID=A0A368GD35_ANCCA|nr:hypothetical protein ANCCAN_11717 [Ancylostoma caninum]